MIKQIATYAKVIKDLCTIKKRHNVKKIAFFFLTEQVSTVIDRKNSPKHKDLSFPTVTCNIGNHACGQALFDLGANVNLMPYSIYLQLGLGEVKPTFIVLQLAKHSIIIPCHNWNDVPSVLDYHFHILKDDKSTLGVVRLSHT